MRTVRAAVIQAGSVPFDAERSLDRLRDLVSDAARRSVRLAVFPEAFISAYPRGIDLGARLGLSPMETREIYRLFSESAVTVPGPLTDQIGQAAKSRRMALVVGVVERTEGSLFSSALFFNTEGELVAKQRKLVPVGEENVIWSRGDGSTMPVVDCGLGRMGAVIAWDNYLPLLRSHMYAQGVQIYCVPASDDRETWLSTLRHIAMEGRCFVLSANPILRNQDLPERLRRHFEGEGEALLCRGGSCVVGPLGNVLAGPHYDSEAVIWADLEMADLARGKLDLDVAGHSARPDVFRLHVNEAPMSPVVYEKAPAEVMAAPLERSAAAGAISDDIPSLRAPGRKDARRAAAHLQPPDLPEEARKA